MPHTGGVKRTVTSRMTADVLEGTDLALLIAVDQSMPVGSESIRARVGDAEQEIEEALSPFGNRLHLLRGLPAGELEITYSAREVGVAPAAPVGPADEAVFVIPSRYCEVDEFAQVVSQVTDGATGMDAVHRTVDWVHQHLSYVPGSSTVLDSARTTFLSRQGVCRDYAHLTATLLRAAGLPARCVSVYAPGLSPMDFHLVVEVLVEGEWIIVDATHLAPRASMVRIASGYDAADTAFMTTLAGSVSFRRLEVTAVVDGELPAEDWSATVPLR